MSFEVENHNCFLFLSAEVSSEYSMDKAMVEFAIMDRELNHYVKAVQSAINHVSLHLSPVYIWLQLTDLEIETQSQNYSLTFNIFFILTVAPINFFLIRKFIQ